MNERLRCRALELLREAVPGTSRVGFLASRAVWVSHYEMAALQIAADRMGISVIGPPLEGAFRSKSIDVYSRPCYRAAPTPSS
jgi:hypothetical protein